MKPVPVIVTVVPPAMGPATGLIPDTVGIASYVKRLALLVALVPPAAVTVILTRPAASAGDIAVIEVSLLTTNELAGVAPNITAVADVKPAPVSVTVVLPDSGPAFGLTAVTVGAATYVN